MCNIMGIYIIFKKLQFNYNNESTSVMSLSFGQINYKDYFRRSYFYYEENNIMKCSYSKFGT